MVEDAGRRGERRDRDEEGRARSSRPRDGLGRPLPYGAAGVARQPEGVVRTPEETVAEAQRLLGRGMPFHAHEVFEDAWKSRPEEERAMWRGLAQLAVGLTHGARGNAKGAVLLLRRGASVIEQWSAGPDGFRRHGLDLVGLTRWAHGLADRLAADPAPVDAAAHAPRLTASH
jgi:uncharacterized protein